MNTTVVKFPKSPVANVRATLLEQIMTGTLKQCQHHVNTALVYQHIKNLGASPSTPALFTYRQWKDEVGLGRAAVDTAVKNLKELGFIRTEVRTDGVVNIPKTNYYLVSSEQLKECE